MAMNRIFGGANLYIPGAYSLRNVLLTGAAPSVAVGKVAIIGESSKGAPGSDGVMQFSPEALKDLITMYGEGAIVDAARALVQPSNDGKITSGASAIYVYKTNPSTKASLALATNWATISSLEYGQEANLISVQIEKANAIDASVTSSAPFDSVNDLVAGLKMSVRVNGGAVHVFTMPAAVVSRATLLAALNNVANWTGGLPSGITWATGGASDAAALLTASQDALSTDHQLGAGRSFELLAGSPDLLSVVNIDEQLYAPSLEPAIRLIAQRALDGINEDTNNDVGNLGGEITLLMSYEGTTATVSITATQLLTTVSGGSGSNLTLSLSNFRTLNDLAAYINAQTGYKASIPATVNGGLSPTILDKVSAIGIASASGNESAGRIKADYYAVYRHVLANSSLIEVPASTTGKGLPDAMGPAFLSGAVRGASASSSFISGLEALEAIEDIDLVIPLVSQDASDDIVEDPTITDSGSTYTASSILAATNSHCRLMSNTKNRKERAMYAGIRGTFSECQVQALALNSEMCSLLIQDVEVLGTDGNLTFKQPHIAAAICAGMQAGADIGEPTTKKLINATAIRHVGKQGLTLSASNTFNPKTKADLAIQKGILPLNNPSRGGIQIMVQNSTYSKDSNFVFNRPSVYSAMNYITKVLRQSLEDKFIGDKNKTSTKDAIEAEIVAIMSDFLRSDITVGDDSNKGLGWKDLAIRIDGNAVIIDITATPVQGIDFILMNLNFDNIRIAA
jgi:hypothetical protein